MVTRAWRDAAQDNYERLLNAAESLAADIDEATFTYRHSSVSFLPTSRAAVESADDVCSRLSDIVRDIREMPVDQ